ncbi:MAG: cytochrome c [Deltaproteobacteria bacterium]|nr:cytochrome c [Deltaproteobacteria bacterium]
MISNCLTNLRLLILFSVICSILTCFPQYILASSATGSRSHDSKIFRKFLSQLFEVESSFNRTGGSMLEPLSPEIWQNMDIGFAAISDRLPSALKDPLKQKFLSVQNYRLMKHSGAGIEEARAFRHALLEMFAVEDAPALSPDFQTGKRLYQRDCQSCHGSVGAGDGPLSPRLPYKIMDFRHPESLRSQSPLMVLNLLLEGSENRRMPSFASVYSHDEMRSLSFYVPCLRLQGEAASGSELTAWKKLPSLVRDRLAQEGLSLSFLSRRTDQELLLWRKKLRKESQEEDFPDYLSLLPALRCGAAFSGELLRKQ